MKNMSLDKIASAVGGKLCKCDDTKTNAQGVVFDNRLIEKDYIFIAIPGERVDGHSFVNKAFEDGALGSIVEKDGDYNGPYILVDSTKQALIDLATYYRSQLTIPIVGIIGSVGKTSTKEMVASVLSEEFNVQKTKGNYNNDMGLPITLLSIKEEHEAAVVEMGVSDFGEMDILGAIARPDIVAFTNIGQCHLENFGTRDGILKGKTEVLSHLNSNATVVINKDDDKLITIGADRLPKDAKLVTYSVSSANAKNDIAMYQATDVFNLGLEGMKAKIIGEIEADVTIPLPGEHNVSNAMCAAAVGHTLGESVDSIVKGIAKASTIAGRSNFIKAGGVTIIDDCYNANPASVRAGLQVLGMADGRKIAILGDMGELGEDELNLHRDLYKSVLDNKIDILLTVGELSSSIAKALDGENVITKSFYGDDGKEQLLEYIKPELKSGDTILVKASHFMNFPVIVNELKESLS